MNSPDHPRLRPARSESDDWLVDGNPVVGDGIDPEEAVQVDRFECVRCGARLTVLVDGTASDRADRIEQRVTCAACDTEQLAIATMQEWQPMRFVMIALGTAPMPRRGRSWSTWVAVAVLVGVIALLAGANYAAATDAWEARLDRQDGTRVEARLLQATETGGGPRMVASHRFVVRYRDGGTIERTIEVDGGTFARYADSESVPVWARRDRATVVGDHEQRDDLWAMLAIDATIIATILGIGYTARRSARDARRDERA